MKTETKNILFINEGENTNIYLLEMGNISTKTDYVNRLYRDVNKVNKNEETTKKVICENDKEKYVEDKSNISICLEDTFDKNTEVNFINLKGLIKMAKKINGEENDFKFNGHEREITNLEFTKVINKVFNKMVVTKLNNFDNQSEYTKALAVINSEVFNIPSLKAFSDKIVNCKEKGNQKRYR